MALLPSLGGCRLQRPLPPARTPMHIWVVLIFEHLNNRPIRINCKYKLNVYVSFLLFSVIKVCFESLSKYVFVSSGNPFGFKRWLKFILCFVRRHFARDLKMANRDSNCQVVLILGSREGADCRNIRTKSKCVLVPMARVNGVWVQCSIVAYISGYWSVNTTLRDL